MKQTTFFKTNLLLLFLAFGIQSFATSPQKPIYIVLLAGQSNMAGSGGYDSIDTETLQKIEQAKSRVIMAQKSGVNPIAPHLSKAKTEKFGNKSFFGPEMTIAVTLCEKYPNQDFLFIKHSMGGTALYGAWNPEWSLQKSQAVEKGERKHNVKLYNEHIQLINEQLQGLEKAGRPYKIIGLAWMQGENDAAKEISAVSYEANLTKLIASYRKALNVPNMPVVFGQINSNYGNYPEGPATVRKAFVDVASKVPNTAVIKTINDGTKTWTDYPKHFDNVHYNAEGQVRLGIAMGKELIKMQN